MKEIHLIDTSVLCCLLPVPGMCSGVEHKAAFADLTALASRIGISLLLPMATIYETGNHIAHATELRYKTAQKFIGFVRAGFASQPPWTLTPLPNHEQMGEWLNEFPEHADRQVGLGDLSIIKTYEEVRALNLTSRVRIWSKDEHLSGYDYQPTGSLFT